MSVAVDANVLLYASDESSPRQATAARVLADVAAGPGLVYLFWPVIMAYLRMATHPSVFDDPLGPDVARRNVAGLIERSHVRCPGEGENFWTTYLDTVSTDVIKGNLVTNSHIAALMRQYGVGFIWSADRDFRRFPDITARDPYRS